MLFEIYIDFEILEELRKIINELFNQIYNEIDKIFVKDKDRAIEILREYCNPSNVFNLMNKDKEAIKKYDLINKEMEELFNKQDKYITENGNELQKETMNLLKDFFINNELVTKNEYDKNIKELADKLKELNEKSEKNKLKF